MRQTGRTSRIVNFAVDQLFSVGRVVVTDHISFEFKVTKRHINHFIDRVRDRILYDSRGSLTCDVDIIKIKDFYVVDFRIKSNKK